MREYEFTFVVQPEISDEGIQSICERFEGLLTQAGAEKLYYDDWGRRRLAYEVRRFQKGHYLILHFLSDGKVVPEIERAARLDDSILRFLTVLADDAVDHVEKRKAEGAALELERAKRAAEKVAREAEEAAAREAAAQEQAKEERTRSAAADDDASQVEESESASAPADSAETAERSA